MARSATEGAELLTTALEVAGEARRRRREQHVGGGRELAVLDQRVGAWQLEESHGGPHRGGGAPTEATPHPLPPPGGPVPSRARHLPRGRRDERVAPGSPV